MALCVFGLVILRGSGGKAPAALAGVPAEALRRG